MTKKEAIAKEYKKQRDRLTKTIRRLKKQGYVVDYGLPAIPKRKTEASVRRLAKIKPSDIRKKSTFVDVTTGEEVAGDRQQTIKRLIKEQKEMIKADPSMEAWIKNNIDFLQGDLQNVSRETYEVVGAGDNFTNGLDEEELIAERIIEVFSDDVYSTGNTRGITIIMNWIERMISFKGKIYVADMLDEANKNGVQLNLTPYDSDDKSVAEAMDFINRVTQLDPEGGELAAEMYSDFIFDEVW